MIDLLVIGGPTASGKTGVSVELAKSLNGEIVSADSMQIYREMNVGTAKVTAEETQGIPHHLIDIVDPNESFSVSEYSALAVEKIEEIKSRGKLPILVGGSGLYVNSVIYVYSFQNTAPDVEYRKELEDYYQKYGKEALFEKLIELSPEKAVLHLNDVKRVIRAIETAGDRKINPYEGALRYNFHAFMINPEREKLYDKINRRVDLMFDNGLLDEAKGVIEKYGLTLKNQSMQAIGYKELFEYFNGNESLDSAVENIKKGTRNYAKRQITWFKKTPGIITYDNAEIAYKNTLELLK